MAPPMNRKAWFCTLYNVARCVSHLSTAVQLRYRSCCLFVPHLVLASSSCFCYTVFNMVRHWRPVVGHDMAVHHIFWISSPPYKIVTLFSTLYLLENMVYTVQFLFSFSINRLKYVYGLRRLVLKFTYSLCLRCIVLCTCLGGTSQCHWCTAWIQCSWSCLAESLPWCIFYRTPSIWMAIDLSVIKWFIQRYIITLLCKRDCQGDVYKAMMYDDETWAMYNAQQKKLEVDPFVGCACAASYSIVW